MSGTYTSRKIIYHHMVLDLHRFRCYPCPQLILGVVAEGAENCLLRIHGPFPRTTVLRNSWNYFLKNFSL